MPSSSSFEQTINALLASFQAKAAGGVTWAEFLQMLHEFTAAAMAAAQQLAQAGPTKKQLVLDAVGKLFDMVAPAIKLPFLPWWLNYIRPIVRPYLRQAVMQAADGILEGIFKLTIRVPAVTGR